jgi:hypothetical protein
MKKQLAFTALCFFCAFSIAQSIPNKALPFAIETVTRSDMFQNGLRVAKVNVAVTGGGASEWTATAVAIAEKASALAVDSIEVSVRTTSVQQRKGIRFRELAHVYYSPVASRTVWDGMPQWLIYSANPLHLATQRDADLDWDFSELVEKSLDAGASIETAERRASSAVVKKYKLPKNWKLPEGNMAERGDSIDRGSFTIDVRPAADSMVRLERCMKDRWIRMLNTCPP